MVWKTNKYHEQDDPSCLSYPYKARNSLYFIRINNIQEMQKLWEREFIAPKELFVWFNKDIKELILQYISLSLPSKEKKMNMMLQNLEIQNSSFTVTELFGKTLKYNYFLQVRISTRCFELQNCLIKQTMVIFCGYLRRKKEKNNLFISSHDSTLYLTQNK